MPEPNQLKEAKQYDGLGTLQGSNLYFYDGNGAQTRWMLLDASQVPLMDESFTYSTWRGLPSTFTRTDPTMPMGMENEWEWQYRYNAMGEREQKREVLHPGMDSTAANGYDWTYYLLGGSKEQLSVWKGLQTSDPTFCSMPGGGGSYVHLYPNEYLTYGGNTASITQKLNNTREYRIADHLGTNRVVVDNTGTVLSTADYEPFGKPLNGSTEDRLSWIDKERDAENGYGSFGVRSYDYDMGRFTSIDPLWESYPVWSPYQYSTNSPLNLTDPTGRYVEIFYEVDGEERSVIYHYGDSYDDMKEKMGGVDNDFVKNVITAFNYIIAADKNVNKFKTPYGAADALKSVAYAEKQLRLREAKGNDMSIYVHDGPINWNPLMGQKTAQGGLQSPSLILVHEMGHAASYMANPDKHNKRREKDGPKYDVWMNAEEQRNIFWNENRAADAMNAIGGNEAKRNSYKATGYKTLGPTTTAPDPNAIGLEFDMKEDH